MKKNISLICINIIICYILFFRINQLFYYTLIIPFLLTLINSDNTYQKYYFIILLPMFYFNIINASIILISYFSLLFVYRKYNIKLLYLTSYILSATISLIFKFYYDSTFFILAPILSLSITMYQFKFKNTPNELLIFALISQVIITDNTYYILISLTLLLLYIIYNKTDYLFIVSFFTMSFQFYYSSNYIVLIYPLLVYLALKKDNIFIIIISIFLFAYSFYLKSISIEVIYSFIVILLILLLNDKNVSIDYFPMLLESFNNEIISFCSFLDNFKINNKEENIDYINNDLIQKFCTNCPSKYTCFNNKLKVYEYLKSIIRNTNTNYNCKYKNEMKARLYTLKKTNPIKENKEHIEMNKLSIALREYSVNLASRNTDVFTNYTKLKKELVDYGFIPFIFEPNCTNDIDIKVGFDKRFDNIAPKLKKLAEKILGEDLSVQFLSNDTLYCYYIITNEVKYDVIFQTMSVSKNNYVISGDNMFAKKYDNGYFKAAIADGMGSGYEAHKLSREAIDLVEKISKDNISDNTSINILNTFYSLNDYYDNYSTLDYISIDLKTGNTILYKMGSTTTYIIRGLQIIPVYNHNLPFGIEDMICTEEICLDDDDLVIMISDGVSEHIDEQLLTNYLKEISKDKPHNITYNIMNKVYEENNSIIKDDMSIIAIRVILR